MTNGAGVIIFLLVALCDVAVGGVLRMPSEVSRFFLPGGADDDNRDDGSNGYRNYRHRHQVMEMWYCGLSLGVLLPFMEFRAFWREEL